MKKFNLLVLVILIAIIFNSCSDIIDSDNNISKTEISFGKVLDNQEKNVLLPLKPGNVWYYEVKNYEDDGTIKSITYDSIVVDAMVQFPGEKHIWFTTRFPFINETKGSLQKYVFMINTEKGLLIRCTQCETEEFLWAKYPEINNLYLSYKETVKITDADNNVIAQETGTIGKSGTDKINISNNDLGNLESIFYQSWFVKETTLDKEWEYMNEYYLPDFGLVRASRFSVANKGIESSKYEYIKSIPIGDNCKNNPVIQVGKIAMGSRIFNAIQLINNYGQTIILNKSDLVIENDEKVNFELITDTYPISIPNADKYNMEYTMSPIKTGKFQVILNVRCNLGCWYKITFEGECL
jgi:hypothetical protein